MSTVAKSAPLRIHRLNGLKVKELIKFLNTANPEAEVWFEAHFDGLSKCRVVDLDAFNPGSQPVVILKSGG